MTDFGTLVLAGAPIGSAQDASPGLVAALSAADVIAAEDTRRLHVLIERLRSVFGEITINARIISYFEGNEAGRTQQIVDALAAGQRVVIITDAGMPSVSDPGYRAVAGAIELGARVTAVPGPSAVLTALAVSGLPVDRFCFEGFLPRKSGERRRRFAELAPEQRTMVFFEAPHRLADFLTDAAAVLGAQRRAAVCRELTKPYEEVIRGGLAELADWASEGARGEISVVIEGAAPAALSQSDALALVGDLVAGGISFKDAVADVAGAHGLVRKDLYAAALAARVGK
ncbi:MAG: 16S rRNA (cytidine(1402)-2'-O)-methyltransferase [Propionibacteriaceae bacterium]